MKIITLKFAGTCKECGETLPVGSRAKWYGRGRVYGLDCHPAVPRARFDADEPAGLTASRHDRYGVYTHDGQRIGCTCGCIDYPCCGH